VSSDADGGGPQQPRAIAIEAGGEKGGTALRRKLEQELASASPVNAQRPIGGPFAQDEALVVGTELSGDFYFAAAAGGPLDIR
jgi:hypothetical protein